MGQITFKENGSIQFKGGSLTFLSYIPMAEPTVVASWSLIAGKYTSKVTITNKDTERARIWYRIGGPSGVGEYILLDPDEVYIIIESETTFPPLNYTAITGEAQAIDIYSLRAPSEVVTHTAYSPW